MSASTAWVFHVCFLFVFFIDGLQAACPPGWFTWQDSCYVFLPERMNWFDATRACDRSGSTVVMPESRDEHDYVWQELNNFLSETGVNLEFDSGLWIGCNVFNTNKQLTCSGVDVKLKFDNWFEGEPNEVTAHCIRMASKYGSKWGDTDCNNVNFAACEMRVPRPVCLTADDDGRFASQCLLNHDIKNLTAMGVIGCGQACWAEPRCHSFNLWQQGKICQLNNATRKADVSDFKKVNDCSYFEL
ncbi:snaclec 3-like [Asterias amurensis]|uniref:snaclec 3-like n=1 Tax=Asterias amurensis TaxID=7602 RepID=UPI003AB5ACF8